MIKTLKELMEKLAPWFEKEIPDARVKNDQDGRKWFLKSVNYEKELKLEDLREYTDRQQLNDDYKERYLEDDVKARKGVSALKIEISALYSFNKCFVQRYKGRLHYYRDDLSQKGARNMATVGQGMGLLEEFTTNLDA